ncbi:MAG: creatininase family protein, partial [Deltaproteobacteria bacterium]|nr:creatininase family protein [Deltaproteobacteria bacterium]
MSPRDPYAPLDVLDALEVGPVRLGRDRLAAPCTVRPRRGPPATLVLRFRWEEPVFTPGEPASENLAAMIAAQASLNYGLFTRRLVFRGPFDAADRRFLADMAENTAREILVNRLLVPNEYLTGAAASLAPATQETYCRASLEFPDAPPGDLPAWDTDPGRHLVLSSGGKESLLTFGLLQELGRE